MRVAIVKKDGTKTILFTNNDIHNNKLKDSILLIANIRRKRNKVTKPK